MLYWIGRWIKGLWCALSTSVFHKIRVPLILYADQASRSASVPSPCKNRGTKHAGMVELVDSVDLGSTANACRFESCCPHQRGAPPYGWRSSLVRPGLEPILMPNASGIWPSLSCPPFSDRHLLGGGLLSCGGRLFCFVNINVSLEIIINENIIKSGNDSRSGGILWSRRRS